MKHDKDFKAISWEKFNEMCFKKDPKKGSCKSRGRCVKERCKTWEKLFSISDGYKAIDYDTLFKRCAYSGVSKKDQSKVCMLERVGESFLGNSCSKEECRFWKELKGIVREIIKG